MITKHDIFRFLEDCGISHNDSAALEQAWQWNEEKFNAYLEENLPAEKQQTVTAQIINQMGLAPMQSPWKYITELQSEFDYGKIHYTEDYYDLDMNPYSSQKLPEWKVCFEGSFWEYSVKQRSGKEIPVNTQFNWAGHHWVIPAVYACAEGLVVDFCMQVEPDDIRSFMEKWNLNIETEAYQEFTKGQQIMIDSDNPLNLDFNAALQLNGKSLQTTHGCGTVFNPCLPDGYTAEPEAKWAADHYGLDSAFGWAIWRSCYPWATKNKPTIKSLSVTMIQEKMSVPGPHFHINTPGDTFSFTYPDGVTKYTLTVREYEPQTIDTCRLPQNMEYPTHHYSLSYTITPELPDGLMTLADCSDSDRPRLRQTEIFEPTAVNDAAVIGIIGGADGPTAIVFGQKQTQSKLRVACSNLHFEPVADVEWRIVFHEKQFDDIVIDIIV